MGPTTEVWGDVAFAVEFLVKLVRPLPPYALRMMTERVLPSRFTIFKTEANSPS